MHRDDLKNLVCYGKNNVVIFAVGTSINAANKWIVNL